MNKPLFDRLDREYAPKDGTPHAEAPDEHRGLSKEMSALVSTGTTEFVALRFEASGHGQYFYRCVTACAAISLIVYPRMPETRGRPASFV